ncbi:MAG TPA: hypothetical protein VLK29_05525 [Luteimonas sp.]|nr:hypothetical protein [Luteimonas sp.]
MTRAPRQTRTASDASQWALRDRSGVGMAAEAQGQDAAAAGAVDPRAMIDDFTASLADIEMDDASREQFGAQFEQAMLDAAANPKADSGLERSDWLQAVDMLRQMGVVDADESNALVRQLDEAMRPLQKRNVQIALEFSRRCAEDGEEKALEWFRAQSLSTADEASQSPAHTTQNNLPQGDSILNSRSRRPRGPPVR